LFQGTALLLEGRRKIMQTPNIKPDIILMLRVPWQLCECFSDELIFVKFYFEAYFLKTVGTYSFY
jgi:hypothetical protein